MQFYALSPLRRASVQASALFNFVFFPLLVILLAVFLSIQDLHAQTPTAMGATFEVNSLGEPDSVIDASCDASSCTLREAINAADAAAGLDTITFAPDLKGNIQLTNRLTIDDDLLLIGPGAEDISITAMQGASALNIFTISGVSTISVTMQSLTIQGAVGGTSAILVQNASFTLEDSILKDNDVNGFGGAMTISARGSAIVSNSTISNNVAIQAGAIYNFGDLTVIDSTFQSNATNGLFGEGGAIRNEGGTLIVRGTTFMNNRSSGSGIVNREGGNVTVTGSTFSNNSGSAIYNYNTNDTVSMLSVTESTFVDGRVGGDGGGILNGGASELDAGGIVTVSNSIFTGNIGSTGGAIANKYGGTFTLENSTVHSNTSTFIWGGGIFNEYSVMTIRDSTISDNQAERGAGIANRRTSTLTIINSTISGNRAVGQTAHCGGISNDGINSLGDVILTVSNSTISSNQANRYGGGICTLTNLAQTTINNSTIVFNRADSGDSENSNGIGGGVYNAGGTILLGSTLLGSNYRGSGNNLDNLSQSSTDPGTITSAGFNLSDNEPAGFGGDDIINSAPMIGSLGNNGGPTETHALFVDSPAIDAGTNVACPATDQRGVSRPLDGNEDTQAVCDIGALEADTQIMPQKGSLHLPSLKK